MNILIFAGGSGTRLWPVSRKSKPKQLLSLINEKTLLQNTYERSLSWTKPNNIYIATLASYKPSIKKQLPRIADSHYSLEPVLRDRGPAIGLAALIMHHHDPNSTFMTMWSDHEINEPKGYFKKLLTNIEKYLNQNPEATITVGIKPKFAHTGFGYIEKGKKVANKFGLPLFQVESFTEKPKQTTADKFVKSKKYLWNSGYFIWKTQTLLDLYQQHLPEVYKVLEKIQPSIGTAKQQAAINRYYKTMPKVEVEQGLLEKISDNILTIEADFNWSDVGSWKTIKDIQSKTNENLLKGLTLNHETAGSLVYNFNPKQIVTTLHVKDLVVVVTPEAVLVANKHNSEELKQIVDKLKNNPKLNKYL